MQAPEDVSVHEGEPATLRALVSGCPVPRLRWFKDGRAVRGPDHEVGQPSGAAPWSAWLRIPEAFPEDSGVYVCTASNLVGNTSACCRLSVFGQSQVKGDLFLEPVSLQATWPAAQLPSLAKEKSAFHVGATGNESTRLRPRVLPRGDGDASVRDVE